MRRICYRPLFSKKETRRYRWHNQVLLNAQSDAPLVDFIEYQIINALGKITFKNVWVTDIAVNANLRGHPSLFHG
jgi:hypothetical protein